MLAATVATEEKRSTIDKVRAIFSALERCSLTFYQFFSINYITCPAGWTGMQSNGILFENRTHMRTYSVSRRGDSECLVFVTYLPKLSNSLSK